MVPMADNLNHSCDMITSEMVNLSLHVTGDEKNEYFRISKYMADYSSVFKANGWSKECIRDEPNITGRIDRKLYESNQKALSTQNISKIL